MAVGGVITFVVSLLGGSGLDITAEQLRSTIALVTEVVTWLQRRGGHAAQRNAAVGIPRMSSPLTPLLAVREIRFPNCDRS